MNCVCCCGLCGCVLCVCVCIVCREVADNGGWFQGPRQAGCGTTPVPVVAQNHPPADPSVRSVEKCTRTTATSSSTLPTSTRPLKPGSCARCVASGSKPNSICKSTCWQRTEYDSERAITPSIQAVKCLRTDSEVAHVTVIRNL